MFVSCGNSAVLLPHSQWVMPQVHVWRRNLINVFKFVIESSVFLSLVERYKSGFANTVRNSFPSTC